MQNRDAFDAVTTTMDFPMYVVTAWDGVERSGCLVGFATQCSINPVHWLVCISKRNHTYGVALRCTTLIVHYLRADQAELAHIFGGETADWKGVNKFSQCKWREGPGGTPVITGCDWLAGRVLRRVDLGDHEGHVLEIFDAGHEHAEAPGLGFQAIRGMTPGHQP